MWMGIVAAVLALTLLARSQTSQNAAGQPHNCPNGTSQKCGSDSRIFPVLATTNPVTLCPGQNLYLCVGTSNALGTIISVITNTDCSTITTTNVASPARQQAAWWTAAGLVQTNGSGICASINMPQTNQGSGSIKFNVLYCNSGVCTDCGTNSVTVEYEVRCPIQTITAAETHCGYTYGALFRYRYDCADNWYAMEIVTKGTPLTCSPGGVIVTTTNAIQMIGNCITDGIRNNNGPPGTVADCSDVTIQTVFIGPSSSNLLCSYSNTQIVTVTRTNGANTPAMGTVVSTSGGVSTNCGW